LCDYPEIEEYVTANQTDILLYRIESPGGLEGNIPLPASLGCFNAVYAPNPSAGSSYPVIEYRVSRGPTSSNDWTGKFMYNDQMILNLGTNGYIDLTTPALIKGKYKVTLVFPYATSQNFIRTAAEGSDGGSMRFTFDDDLEQKSTIGSPVMSLTADKLGVYEWVMFDEIEFEETSTHTFRLTFLDPEASSRAKNYRLHFDYLRFEPILD
ncbi:MAG: DUF5108 domain-containing protein, partial [Rikenellaceae bacterium]|nr:DUF5108 domain-containing protein [Rikenellaceae bacterium]